MECSVSMYGRLCLCPLFSLLSPFLFIYWNAGIMDLISHFIKEYPGNVRTRTRSHAASYSIHLIILSLYTRDCSCRDNESSRPRLDGFNNPTPRGQTCRWCVRDRVLSVFFSLSLQEEERENQRNSFSANQIASDSFDGLVPLTTGKRRQWNTRCFHYPSCWLSIAAPFRRISIGREVRGKRSRCNDAKAVVRYNWRQVIESGLDEELTF